MDRTKFLAILLPCETTLQPDSRFLDFCGFLSNSRRERPEAESMVAADSDLLNVCPVAADQIELSLNLPLRTLQLYANLSIGVPEQPQDCK